MADNKYDALLAGDPYGAIIDSERRADIETSLSIASDRQPDVEAKLQKLAKETGIPLEAVRLVPQDVEKKAIAGRVNYDDLLKKSPATAAFLADPNNAALAHDEIDGITKFESTISNIRAPYPTVGNYLRGVKTDFVEGLDKMRQGMRMQVADLFGNEKMSADAQRKYQQADFQQELARPGFETKTAGGIYGGVTSIARQAPAIALSVATGNPLPVLASAGAQTESDAYGKYRTRGATPGQALLGGTGEGAVEVATELLPMGFLVKNFGKVGAGQFLSGLLAKEVPTEQVATLVQDAIDTAVANPDKTWQQYIAERPDAAYQTLLATAVQSGAFGAAHTVASKIGDRGAQLAQAQETAARVQEAGEAAASLKLTQRMPEKTRELVERALQGDQNGNAYVSAEALSTYFQSIGIDPVQGAADLGAKDFEEALVAGADVAIPMVDYVTKIAASEHAQALLPDTRFFDISAPTVRESEQFESEREEITARFADDMAKSGVEQSPAYNQIREDLVGQLSGRYDRSTADSYATLYAKGITTLAERAGVDPMELHQRYGLTVNKPLPDVLQKKAGSDITIDPLLDRLRSGDIPSQQEIYGESPDGPQDQQKLELRDQLQAIDEALNHYGIDLNSMTNEQVRAALDNSSGRDQNDASILNQGENNEANRSELQADENLLTVSGGTARPGWTSATSIVGTDGRPARAYRGAADLLSGEHFDRSALGHSTGHPSSGLGVWFSLSEDQAAQYGEVEEFHLDLRNPAEFTIENFPAFDSLDEAYAYREQLRAQGYDGIVVDAREVGGPINAVAFDAEQAILPGTGMQAQEGDTATFYQGGKAIDEFKADLTARYPGVKIDLYGKGNTLNLSRIVVPNDERNAGTGSSIMQEIVDYADATGKVVTLSPSADFGGTVSRLKEFYKRFGFVENKGRSKDFEISESMYREPRKFQGDDTKRGFIQFGKDRKFNITLLEKADLSTFLHESGHFFLEVMGDLAKSSPEMQADMDTLLKWFGVDKREDIQTEHHEKFARGFEAYLMEGKAPSQDLRAIFQRFKAWLTLIYKQLSGLNVKLNDDVRAVMDRMVASDAEIEDVKQSIGSEQIFATAADAGMTNAEFDAYRKTVEQASEQAKDGLQQKLMEEFQRRNKEWYKEQRAQMEAQVRAETEEQPVYLAFNSLVSGKLPDGTPIKLDKEDLAQRYGTEYLKRLPRSSQRVYAADGGMGADMAAEVFGFQSGDEMTEALVNMRPMKDVIKAETDARMDEQLGNMLRDGTMYDEAVAALHNDKRGDVLAAELRALRRKQREVSPIINAMNRADATERRAMNDSIPPLEAFRGMASGMIGQKQVRDLNPTQYLNAERKASREAFKAAAKGDYQVAATAKQRELLNHFLFREASAAQVRAEKAAEFAKSLEKTETREKIGKAGESYLEAIDAVLEAYEFRKTSNKNIDLRSSLRSAMAKAEENGEVIDVMTDDAGNIIDPAILNARNYRELTVDELGAVHDTLKNIVHVAREQGKFRAAEVKASFDDIASKALTEIQSGTKEKELPKRSMRDPKSERLRAIAGIPQSWRSLNSYVQEATGFKKNSTLWNYVVRPLNDAAAKESVMLKDASGKLDDLFKRYGKTYLYGKGTPIPGVGPLNKMERLMIAASYGTETGRQRLRDNGFNGTGFSQQELDAILGSLEEKDWGFVQELWKLFDSYWSQVEDKQQRVTGVRPEKVQALPFQTKFGMMPGGYSPIAYESRADNRAAAQDAAQIAKEMKQAAYTRSSTRRGHTKQRVESVKGKKVRYDFGVIYKHLNEVIHDITHHEPLRDVQKLLNHNVDGTSIIDEITNRMGDGVRDQIRNTLDEVAVGDMRQMSGDEKFFEKLAKGSSMASMSYNVWNAVQNATGAFNSMGVIGASNFIGGAKRWSGSPKHMLETIDEIYEKSPFMKTRAINMNRDINAMRGKLEQMSGKPVVDNALEAYKSAGFWMMVRMQQLVDVPTWIGAYEAAKRSDPNMTEANAVSLADQAVVDSQGGGRTVDLSKFMRGKGMQRVWTVFAGYFNVTYQRVVEAMKRAKVEDYSPQAIGRAVTDVGFLTAAPALMTTLMKEAVEAMVGDDDEDEEGVFAKYQKEQLSYLMAMFPYLRETTAAVSGYGGYSGPVGARFFADLNKLITQTKQGELDENLGKAAVRTAGSLTGLPAGQMIKTYDGFQEMVDGKATPLALAFGPPKD